MKDIFDKLAQILGGIESDDIDIEDVAVAASRSEMADSIDADVTATIPVTERFETPPGSEVRLDDVEITDEGLLRADLAVSLAVDAIEEAPEPVREPDEGTGTTVVDGTETSEDDGVATDETTATSEGAPSGAGTEAPGDTEAEPPTEETGDETRDGDARREAEESVPPHHDPARLDAVYDPEKTFKEMTDELGVDVTPQTVRRQMIEHGIHEPGSDAEGNDSGDETESGNGSDAEGGGDADDAEMADEARPNGRTSTGDRDAETATDGGQFEAIENELPAGVTGRDLKEAVQSARTVYEVQRRLGLEREETCTLLEQFDLLECVSRRLAAAERDGPSEDEIAERIRSATAD